MKYILDFDRTVFDMDALYEKIESVNPGVEVGTVESLKDINLEELLFPDALDFFSLQDQENIQIVSSSFGLTGQWDLEYQKIKIEKSNVAQYVSDVHVVADSKISTIKRIARNVDQAVYVDDHPEHVLNAMQHISGLTVVYINRKNEQPEIPGVKTIRSLAELEGII